MSGTKANPHLLVVGAGSVGRRHARNLASRGVAISAVDPRADRLDELAAEVELHERYPDHEAALAAGAFDGLVVASPTAFHVEQAVAALERDVPVLLEKPLGTDLDTARHLASAASTARVPVLLGYTWRWWTALRRVRELVRAGEVGRVLHVRCTLSAHLADWHPWEPYEDFFMAHQELGGGALLDESHWIDLACWLFGAPDRVFARIERLSQLRIDTDDNVDLLLVYDDGPRVWLHLDIHGRPHERSLTVAGSEGTVRWTDAPNVVAIGRGADRWEQEEFPSERNDMFLAVADEFLDVSAGAAEPSCTVDDGLAVMRVIDAARRSHGSGGLVEVASG